jgi:hypothetical protein
MGANKPQLSLLQNSIPVTLSAATSEAAESSCSY